MFRARTTHTRNQCMEIMNYEGCEFIIYDTETTGLDPETSYIIELAAVKIVIKNRKPEITEKINMFIRPPFKMEDKVVEIHGITNEKLENEMSESSLFETIRDFFGPYPYVIGYNVAFDNSMMSSLYRRNGAEFTPQSSLDVLDMTRDLFVSSDYHLGTIAREIGADIGLNFHQALDDVIATKRVFEYCCNEYAENIKNECSNKIRLHINYITFWKGHNKTQTGIWVNTNRGRVYFSTFNKAWMSSKVNLDEIDINTFEYEVRQRLANIPVREFEKLTEKKFEKIKAFQKNRGIRI